jgi:hypothetical protein
LLTLVGASAALWLPFVLVKANRIVPGEPRGLWEALPALGAGGCAAVLLVTALVAVLVGNARTRLGVAPWAS